MAPTPVLLPGKSHERRSLVGCSPRGRKESETIERLHFSLSPPKNGIKYKSNKIFTTAVGRKFQNSDELNKKLNKWNSSPRSQMGRLTSIKMSVLLNLIYRINTIPIKISAIYLVKINKLIVRFM